MLSPQSKNKIQPLATDYKQPNMALNTYFAQIHTHTQHSKEERDFFLLCPRSPKMSTFKTEYKS